MPSSIVARAGRRTARGELSYSEARALARVATERNEGELLEAARHATAHHVEAMVRQFRRSQELADLRREARQCARRQLVYELEEDGGLALKVRLTAESGVVVAAALAAAMAEVPLPGVAAETSRAAGQVSAGTSLTPGDVAAETLTSRGVDRCELEDGPAVAVETERRFACDASLIAILEDVKGEPLDVGRKTRTIPPALRRALASRDGGCVFPGCTHGRHVDGHHLQHWFHHRAVHEGGLRVARLDGGAGGSPGPTVRCSSPCRPSHAAPAGRGVRIEPWRPRILMS